MVVLLGFSSISTLKNIFNSNVLVFEIDEIVKVEQQMSHLVK